MSGSDSQLCLNVIELHAVGESLNLRTRTFAAAAAAASHWVWLEL